MTHTILAELEGEVWFEEEWKYAIVPHKSGVQCVMNFGITKMQL